MQDQLVQQNSRKPENNIIQVSFKREVKFWEYLTKVYFQYFDQVELVAKGRAIYLAVRAAKCLQSKELATYDKIETFISTENSNDQKKKNLMIKPSIKIILRKDIHFEQKMQMMKLVKNQQEVEQNNSNEDEDEDENEDEDEDIDSEDQLIQKLIYFSIKYLQLCINYKHDQKIYSLIYLFQNVFVNNLWIKIIMKFVLYILIKNFTEKNLTVINLINIIQIGTKKKNQKVY